MLKLSIVNDVMHIRSGANSKESKGQNKGPIDYLSKESRPLAAGSAGRIIDQVGLFCRFIRNMQRFTLTILSGDYFSSLLPFTITMCDKHLKKSP